MPSAPPLISTPGGRPRTTCPCRSLPSERKPDSESGLK